MLSWFLIKLSPVRGPHHVTIEKCWIYHKNLNGVKNRSIKIKSFCQVNSIYRMHFAEFIFWLYESAGFCQWRMSGDSDSPSTRSDIKGVRLDCFLTSDWLIWMNPPFLLVDNEDWISLGPSPVKVTTHDIKRPSPLSPSISFRVVHEILP